MLRVVSHNLNGIRSAARKGWLDWIVGRSADVVCVQELKAQADDLDDAMKALGPANGHFHFALKRGYSGVGLYARKPANRVITGFGVPEFDDEGRYVEVDFGPYTVISLYAPSGSSSPERLASKFRFMPLFKSHLQALRDSGREVIVCGDWNVAHKEIDLKNWRSNQKNAGFLPEERQWLTDIFDEVGFVDVFRRLDERAEIFRAERFSDHAALVIDYDFKA